MRNVIASIIIAGLIVLLGGVAAIYAGLYDVAANDPHWPVTRWVLETARVRSIKAHASGVVVPPGFDDSAKVLAGVGHFAAHCAVCHGAPGVPKGDIARGLNPSPPDLAKAASTHTPAELFWIVKHGIKMTGMPAWSDHTDDELWATVAFLKKLPGISQQDYGKLVIQAMGQNNQNHGGDQDQKSQTRPGQHDHH